MHIDLINTDNLRTVAQITDDDFRRIALLSNTQKALEDVTYLVIDDETRPVYTVEDVERNCFEFEVQDRDFQKLIQKAGLEYVDEY